MSDTWVAPGWWLASDGRWYPPESADNETVGATFISPVIEAPVVLDLRPDEPVIEPLAPAVLAPPPVPAPMAQPGSAHRRSGGGSGTRWGGHRRIAPPIGTSPAE